MKVKVVANELLDSSIEFVSLVKNGAIRSPFKILKNDEELEMTRQRNQRREQLLAERRGPRIRRNSLAAIQKAAQRASDVGCAAIFKDEFEPDVNADRHGADPLQATRPEELGFWESFSGLGGHFREVIAMLRATGQTEAAEALAQAMRNIERAGSVTKQEEALLLRISSAFKGGGLDWLEQQGQMMADRNAALMRDVALSDLDESMGIRNDNAGIEKADGDRVLDSAFDSGMGVTGRYK